MVAHVGIGIAQRLKDIRLLKRAQDLLIIWIICFGISIPIVLYLENPTAPWADRGFESSPVSDTVTTAL